MSQCERMHSNDRVSNTLIEMAANQSANASLKLQPHLRLNHISLYLSIHCLKSTQIQSNLAPKVTQTQIDISLSELCSNESVFN